MLSRAPATSTHKPVTEILNPVPSPLGLLCKVPFKSSFSNTSKAPVLPNHCIEVPQVNISPETLGLYHQVVNWQAKSAIIHPCMLHVLAFPLHLYLLLKADFPFKILGLVHIENSLRQVRPLYANESYNLVCYLADLHIHRKGWLFSIVVEARVAGELVWVSTSRNLSRAKHGLTAPVSPKADIPSLADASEFFWRLESDLGRRYAKAAKDYNPIHLYPLSAKLFGFKRAIMHGMWTKARCMSQIQLSNSPIFEQPFEVNTQFKLPLYLPSKVRMRLRDKQPSSLHFLVDSLSAEQQSTPHLVGKIKLN